MVVGRIVVEAGMYTISVSVSVPRTVIVVVGSMVVVGAERYMVAVLVSASWMVTVVS